MRPLLLAALAALAAAPAPASAQSADPHAGHVMPAEAPPAADPHAGHEMPEEKAEAADPHAGHEMPEKAESADPHAGHGAAQPAPPAAPAPADAARGPAHAADRFWNPADMAAARKAMREEHGGMTASRVLIDRLEARLREGRDVYAWDAEAWWGGDIDKLWLKSEGEGAIGGRLERTEVQALWSRAIDPWFDLQLGLRRDLGTGPDRTFLVAGLQGLAPYWIEIDGAVFLSEKGDVGARVEAEYDLRITRTLILQPRGELGLALQEVAELGTGAGVTGVEAGLRLRYELRPQFAPYLGLHYERALGGTARFRRAAGEEAGGWALVLGVRAWF